MQVLSCFQLTSFESLNQPCITLNYKSLPDSLPVHFNRVVKTYDSKHHISLFVHLTDPQRSPVTYPSAGKHLRPFASKQQFSFLGKFPKNFTSWKCLGFVAFKNVSFTLLIEILCGKSKSKIPEFQLFKEKRHREEIEFSTLAHNGNNRRHLKSGFGGVGTVD
ncbi:hypothetical protein JTE90_016231 [Oedothorax gibbosus]|uniref:Uncharacterized protein n=1 Tax=Oedothorax gibbosus TaxID=931172 RepID=A0AAV6VQZ0_9ARAC|nr:hypothetical protein JTE90_016231 [Oedothorax gibbosus]